jgi:oligoribonuclease NrnB/cAMP/cGMP phosphodiesterase (DHH superfamily)
MGDKHLVIYHKNCNDGTCAAAIVKYFLGADKDVNFLPLSYEDGFTPDVVDNETILWLVDFSFPMELMWRLNDKCRKVIWFDHHQSAINKLLLPEKLANTWTVLDPKKSGAGITWDELFPDTQRPVIVNNIEDRDLWKFKLPFSRILTEAIATDLISPKDDRWSVLFSDDYTHISGEIMKDLITSGQALDRAKKIRIDRAIKRGYWGMLKGHKTFFVNATEDISELGEKIYLSNEEPVVAAIYHFVDHNTIKVSLRSTTVNVREIAESFPNGGGHDYAAGFSVQTKNILNELGDKK